MFTRFASRLAAVVFASTLPSIALAQQFSDEPSFLAALDLGSTTYGFDDLEMFPELEVLTNQLAGVDFTDPVTATGSARIWRPSDHPEARGADHTFPNTLLNFGSGTEARPISIRFTSPVNGVGLYNTSVEDDVRLTLLDACGQVVFQGDLVHPDVQFLGYVSAVPIASASVVGVNFTNGTILVDTLSFGRSSSGWPSCRAGNIGTSGGGPAESVLSIAGYPVDSRHEVRLPRDVAQTLQIGRPTTGNGKYLVWIYEGEPGPGGMTPVQFNKGTGICNLGIGCRRLPVGNLLRSGGAGCPGPTWDFFCNSYRGITSLNIAPGAAQRLFVDPVLRPAAPTTVTVSFPEGTWTICGLFVDSTAPCGLGIANWVIVRAN